MVEVIDNLTEKKEYGNELEASIRRAFVDNRADFIVFDGHTMRNEFLRDSINYGLEQGLLRKGETIEEEQWTTIRYRLSDKGKKYFGIIENFE
ncbi:MAG TPA: hypothetical protein ENI22_02515 [Candidatus Pacearchaeota archaeon]|nr:hypothetical protein [Candidatus Pacearchaeota archaeon]